MKAIITIELDIDQDGISMSELPAEFNRRKESLIAAFSRHGLNPHPTTGNGFKLGGLYIRSVSLPEVTIQ